MKQARRGVRGRNPANLQLPEKAWLRLDRYVELLDEWRKVTNLVSKQSFAEVWTRHIADSQRIFQAFPLGRSWLDIGSGAGFPGIVLGILLAEEQGARIHCVEADNRKCAFLRFVAQDLSLPVKVYPVRAEELGPTQTGHVDALTARAFSSLDRILNLGSEYLAHGTVAILPRGRTATREIETVDSSRYILDVESNLGRSDGLIFKIWKRGATTDASRRIGDEGG